MEHPQFEYLQMWGEHPQVESDIWRVFECHLSGEPNDAGVSISRLPWSEKDLSPETLLVKSDLVRCAHYGTVGVVIGQCRSFMPIASLCLLAIVRDYIPTVFCLSTRSRM